MSDQVFGDDFDDDDLDYKRGSGGVSGKHVVLIVLLVLVLGLGVGGYFLVNELGLLGGDKESTPVAEAPAHATEPSSSSSTAGAADITTKDHFVAIPDLLVNLAAIPGSRRQSFMKISATLEVVSPADRARIEELMPKIVDSFQTHLRTTRADEMQGTNGLEGLRQQLLIRVNTIVAPIQVRNVLFQQMLVQ